MISSTIIFVNSLNPKPNNKITNFFLFLALLLGISLSLNARKITLIKIGGNAVIYTSNGTIQPSGATINTIGSNSHAITYNETILGPVSDWSKYFHYLSECINQDIENDNTNVEYRIEIESPDLLNPMIIGEQYINLNWKIASTGLIVFDGSVINGQALGTPIHKVTVNGMSGGNFNNAYLKYIEGYKYGTYLKFFNSPGYTPFYYYHVQKYDGSGSLTDNYYCTYSPPPNNPPLVIVTSQPYSSPISNTNPPTLSSPFPTLNTVVPNGNWTNVSEGTSSIKQAYHSNLITNILSDNLMVNNLIVDGNSTHADMSFTMYGDVGKQIPNSGIAIYSSNNTSVNNCEMSHFCLDGLSINGKGGVTNIANCIFDYNGRTGIAWLGGKNVSATNVKCRYTGIGAIATSPTCGMDIENEVGCVIPPDCQSGTPGTDCYVLEHGNFKECFFQYAAATEVVNDTACELQASLANDVTLDHCTFDENDGYWGLWLLGEDIRFINGCNINTRVIYTGFGSSTIKAIKFTDCHFHDQTSDGFAFPDNVSIINLEGARRTLFKDCDFSISLQNKII